MDSLTSLAVARARQLLELEAVPKCPFCFKRVKAAGCRPQEKGFVCEGCVKYIPEQNVVWEQTQGTPT